MRTCLPSSIAVLSKSVSTSPGLARADHIQQPVTAVFVPTELDADRPIGVVELGFFGGGEIPVADDVKVGRDRVNDRTPFPFEVEAGGGPDLPVAARARVSVTTAAMRDIPG